MAKTIRNGRAFPKSVKSAVLDELRNGVKSQVSIGAAHNVSSVTVSAWGAAAGIAPAISQPVQLAAHCARLKTATAFNTPIPQADGSILFKGKSYR